SHPISQSPSSSQSFPSPSIETCSGISLCRLHSFCVRCILFVCVVVFCLFAFVLQCFIAILLYLLMANLSGTHQAQEAIPGSTGSRSTCLCQVPPCHTHVKSHWVCPKSTYIARV